MGNQFLYDTAVRFGVVSLTDANDYHPSYPVTNIQNFWTDYVYRSKYGSGSGWGVFYVDATNNKIDFNDGSLRVATLTAGSYDADELAAHIKTQMDAVGGQTYTVSYSNSTNKFTISASGNFSLLWYSGANHATTVGTTIGFYIEADDTGTNTYTGDYVRIHSYVCVKIALPDSSSFATTGCALFGLNLSAAYQTFKLQRWTGSTYVDVANFTYNSVTKEAIALYSSVSGTHYRIYICDWTNGDGYIQIGAATLGEDIILSRGYEYGATNDLDDTSEPRYSKQGYMSVKVGFDQDIEALSYEVLYEDEVKLKTLWYNTYKRYPFVFIRDPDNPSTTMKLVIFSEGLSWTQLDDYFKGVTLTFEKVK